MVNRHIAEYMASSRRLIIPGVGALVRRTDGGEIVFVEMFKQNDGVLVGLLSQKMDISAEQAGILVERFITELQHDLRYYGYYTIPALGTLRQGEKSITFENDAPAAPQPEQLAPAKEPTPPTPRYEPVVEQEIVAAPTPKAEQKPIEQKPVEVKPEVKPEAKPEAKPEVKPAAPAQVAKPAPAAKPAPKKAAPAKDSVKFKLYTKEEDIKPQEATQERFRFEAHRDSKDNQPQHIRIRTNRKRKKMDPVTLLAIIAAAIAVVVIIYGLVSSPGPAFDEPLLPVEPDTAAVELVAPESVQ